MQHNLFTTVENIGSSPTIANAMLPAVKIKVYELDFGDTNLLDKDPQVLLNWMKTDMKYMKEGDELDYKITIRMMTQEEIDALPEWS